MAFPVRRSKPKHTGKNDDRGVVDPPNQVLPSAETDPNTNTNITYRVNNREHRRAWAALVDRGANGGIAGRDTRVIDTMERTIDLSGIDDHTVRNLPLVTTGGVVRSDRGDILLIMNQYAYMPDGKTIHSSGQMEWFEIKVQDRTKKASGEMPYVQTLEGCIIPLAIRNGLPYMKMRPPTKGEMSTLPRIHITEDKDWNPKVLDTKFPEEWYEQTPKPTEFFEESIYDINGDVKTTDKEEDEPGDDVGEEEPQSSRKDRGDMEKARQEI